MVPRTSESNRADNLSTCGMDNLLSLWQTVAMTTQHTNQPKQVPARLEDRKAQKLMADIESRLALQSKTGREPASPSKN
jgi:hypothetical protein